tara:strand:- start:621 stop:833 length:213 start_codon:yes stop_codon:yes gene_type:complete
MQHSGVSITLNGQHTKLPSNSLKDLIDSSNLENKRFAIEVNKRIVPKSKHNDFLILDGDNVEIVEAVGGG